MAVYYEGSLLDWLRQRTPGTFTLQEVASMIRQAAYALQYAHNYQIIYQKVAPSNFLIRSDNEHPNLPDLQLVDVRKATSPDGLPNIASFMAPEQWHGNPVPATDQYALAILAYQLLTWQAPFQGNQEQLMYQHLNVQPQPPGRLNPGIPPVVDAVILRALAKKPEDRFPSISAFADAFQQAVQTSNALPISQTPGAPVAAGRSERITSKPSSQMRGLLLLGIVFIIVVSGIGFGFYVILKNNQAAGSSETDLARAITSSKPIFADNLSSNIIGLWDSDKTACVFEGGTYHVLVPTADTLNGCGEQKFTIDNFAIEVDVSLLSGNNAGVYFRFNKSKDLYYLFSITKQGEFFFAVMHGQTPYAIIQPTKTTAIAAGNARNTLLVIGKGSDFKFFINGVFVGEAQNNLIPSGFMGFFVQTSKAETSGEASFSNLKMFNTTAISSTS